MLISIVTDEELIASEIVKTILLVLIAVVGFYNLYRLVRNRGKGKKYTRVLLLMVLLVLAYVVGNEYMVEAAMLKHPQYVVGTTTGFGSVFALGRGIEFEYEVNGKVYKGCDTFYPIEVETLKVPGGTYRVRLAASHPERGRMDFLQPVNQ